MNTISNWLIFVLVILVVLGSIQIIQGSKQLDMYEKLYYEEHELRQYYFDGANKRNLLDFCTDGKIRFKEDCTQ